MGSYVSKRAAAPAPRPARADVYALQGTADGVAVWLPRIRESREAGTLRAVTVDCRTCGFDQDAMDLLHGAAGVHKVVMHL
jgi:hypothetical protein